MDFDAAGSLAEELPWWGWLEDGWTCLTRAGELMSIGRVTPSVLDGQTPEQLDRVIDRWQRMLSGVDSRTRLLLLFVAPSGPLRERRRWRSIERGRARTAQAPRIPGRTSAGRERLRCMGARSAAIRRHHAKDGRAVVDGHCQELDGAEAQPAEFRLSPFLYRERGGELPAVGSKRAGRWVDDLTPVRVLDAGGSVSILERSHQPARNLLARRDRQRHELEAGRLRTRSGAAQSALGRGACHSLLASLPAWSGQGESSTGALPARCDPDGDARMASAAPRCRPAQNPGSAAPLLLEALLDGGARSRDRRKRGGDGGLGGGGRIGSLGRCPGRIGNGRDRLW